MLSMEDNVIKNWMSIHIFYASNVNPMLVEAIEPLIGDLRERGLIQRSFFIKYWLEGPHIRLRLLPAESADEEEIKQRVEEAIYAYLKRRPALYSADHEGARSFYKDMFIVEYGEQKWIETYGENGTMAVRPNNSLHYIAYEPEYHRYGGVDGVEVAEWHFEKSSEIVMRLIREMNLHVRSILLGLSIQLSLPMCFCFLQDERKTIDFFTNYRKFWMENYQKRDDLTADFEKKFQRTPVKLQQRIQEIWNYAVERRPEHMTSLERDWADHIHELKFRIDCLIAERRLIFQDRYGEGKPFIPEDPFIAYNLLLSGYIHMTNNRLSVLIRDEVYLAHLLRHALEERLHA